MVFEKLDFRNRWINKELINISGDLGTLQKLDEDCWVNENTGELFPKEEDNYTFNELLGKYILIVQGNPWDKNELPSLVICISKLKEYSKDLKDESITGFVLTECQRFYLVSEEYSEPTIVHDEIFFWTFEDLTKEIIELTENEYEEIGAALSSIAFRSTEFNPNDLPFNFKYK